MQYRTVECRYPCLRIPSPKLIISLRVLGSIFWTYRESTQGVELKAPGVGFEPPWFSLLGWMNTGYSSSCEFLSSDNRVHLLN
jgi:hypothetical protein